MGGWHLGGEGVLKQLPEPLIKFRLCAAHLIGHDHAIEVTTLTCQLGARAFEFRGEFAHLLLACLHLCKQQSIGHQQLRHFIVVPIIPAALERRRQPFLRLPLGS